jgi:Arc/MetJ-type ribon-helix-helix transcriptional regulator
MNDILSINMNQEIAEEIINQYDDDINKSMDEFVNDLIELIDEKQIKK